MIRKHVFIIASILMSLSCEFALGQSKTAAELIGEGNIKLEKHDYYGALDAFNEALNLDPDLFEGFIGRAKTQNQMRNYEKALNDVTQALDLNPEDINGYIVLSNIYANLGEYENALSEIEKGLSIDDTDRFAMNQKIMVLIAKGELKEAMKILEEAIKTNDGFAPFYHSRGILNNTREKYERAVEDFNKAEELDKNVDAFDININRGFSHMALQNFEAALENFTTATRLNPTNPGAFHGKARANYLLDNYEQAVADLNKSLEFNESPVTYYDLGMTYLRMEDLTNACKNFQKSCQLGNKNACKNYLLECDTKLEGL